MDDTTLILLQLLIWLVFGIACGFVAHARGRNGIGWFFIGLIGGCFALVILFVIPDLKEESARKDAEERRRRKLEEELMQERSKNHAFRSHATGRLDHHDTALGMDTRGMAPGLKAPPPPPRVEGADPGMRHGWYHLDAMQQSAGPFDLEQMRAARNEGRLPDEVLVWHESMPDWAPLQGSALAKLLA